MRIHLFDLPKGPYELMGRPHLLWELRDYEDAKVARLEVPFLFHAFEAGQQGPPPPGPPEERPKHVPTIHEYLDWTVTAKCPRARWEPELDFAGFRTVVAVPRHRPAWPRPDATPAGAGEPGSVYREQEGQAPPVRLLPPVPALAAAGRPMCAATVRVGAGYLEIPFFATQPSKQYRGYGRCLLEAIEAMARKLGMRTLLLCSTNDPRTLSIWRHFGFTTEGVGELWEEFGLREGGPGLLHLQNTVNMWKTVPPFPNFGTMMMKHGSHFQRLYYAKDGAEEGGGGDAKDGAEEGGGGDGGG